MSYFRWMCQSFPWVSTRRQQGKFPLVSCLAPFQISNKPLEYAGTAFTMLKMFRLEHEVEKLLGGRVNSLSNVLTLSHDVHKAFDRFGI